MEQYGRNIKMEHRLKRSKAILMKQYGRYSFITKSLIIFILFLFFSMRFWKLGADLVFCEQKKRKIL
jgi:hypothetical protein